MKGTPQDGRAQKIVDALKKVFPDAHCELRHENAFQLLAATILSAQCTDERVNMVTPRLFEKYPDARALASADLATLQDIIKSTGFFNAKARSLLGMARGLVEHHDGEVPRSIDALVQLPGVGRKTANVVLGNVWNEPQGLVVDTHVRRLTGRMGLTAEDDPERIEEALSPELAREDWTVAAHLFIWHGRYRCTARAPECAGCAVARYCPSDSSGVYAGPKLAALIGTKAARRVAASELRKDTPDLGLPQKPKKLNRPAAKPTKKRT